ncbi:MAG: hypothetical protein LBT75_02305 [Bacilli bacterium]|jgi:ABC-type glycerol-3-phosphate transport system substrate-binding protein|nr:hypothetical protein [Bacilli bacterium]
MKKIFMALLVSCTLLVGCGGKDDTSTTTPAKDVTVLSKADYEQKFYDQFMEIQTIATEVSSGGDLDSVLKKADDIIDKTIDLKGPTDLDAKEKAIDDSLLEYKEILHLVKDIAEGKGNASDYGTKLTNWSTNFQKALTDYGFTNIKV